MPKNDYHFLIVSYHMGQSSAVGARRTTALASYLMRNGASVSVVRGAQTPNPPMEDVERDLVVRFPRKRLSKAWRELKARFRRQPDSASNPPAMTPQGWRTKETSLRRSPLSWLRQCVQAWNRFLQGDKLWLVKCYFRLRKLPRNERYSAVIASGPPIASYLAGLLAARRFGAPLVLDFRDPWFLHDELRKPSHLLYRKLGALEDRLGQYCVKRASLTVAASPGIEDHLTRTYELGETDVVVVRNGYDEHSIIDVPPPGGFLRLIYAGTLYYNRDPFPFLEAVARLVRSENVDRSKISFKLIGKCAQWNGRSVTAWTRDREVDDVVSVDDPVPYDQLAAFVEASNVLVNFSQGQRLQIPAKTYEHLASGRDVVCIAESDSDVARLYREAEFGFVIEPDDVDEMYATLTKLYDKHVDADRTEAFDVPDTTGFRRDEQFRKLLPPLRSVSTTL